MTKMPLNAEEGGAETTLTPASGQKKEQEEEEAAAKLYAVELLRTSAVPMVLKAVIELGVLEIIAQAGPGASLSASEIASRLPEAVTNPDAPATLDRLLRFLACHSILTCSSPDGTAERLYGLGRLCKFFTKSQGFGVSLASFCLMNHHRVFMDSWYHLKDALVEGGVPFNMAHGMTLSEYQQTDPQFNKVFNDGMSDYSAITMKKILRSYTGFEGLGSVVNVGGGAGANLGMVVSKYPSIKGINFDLPHVIREAPMYSGVEHVAGDMFESVPKGDAIFMKWICHNWSDEHCLKLLKNCDNALPNNGKVIVAECILPAAPDASLATKGVVHIDVMMLAHNPDGKERTEKEFQALAKGAGFQGFRVVCSAFNTYVMEFLK